MNGQWMENIDIAVQCDACGDTYGVPAATVAASHALLADGCPMSSPETCPAGFFGGLVDPEVLDELRRAWAAVELNAAQHGAIGPVLRANPALRRPPSQAERRDRGALRDAIARWEDEGGR